MILGQKAIEKPWGVSVFPAPFKGQETGNRIGEIWFEPDSALDQLLVKYIFTSQALSVQVHPSDAQTMARGIGKHGKVECWLILDAEPGAKLGIGFVEEIGRDEMRAAAQDGSIERLLAWHPVQAGDFFYIPANTVHAIGPGVSKYSKIRTSLIVFMIMVALVNCIWKTG